MSAVEITTFERCKPNTRTDRIITVGECPRIFAQVKTQNVKGLQQFTRIPTNNEFVKQKTSFKQKVCLDTVSLGKPMQLRAHNTSENAWRMIRRKRRIIIRVEFLSEGFGIHCEITVSALQKFQMKV